MSSQTRNYTIRLSASGKRELERDLKAVGLSGQKSLKLIQKASKPASSGLKETDRAARNLKEGLRSVSRELPALQRLARFMGTTALIGGLVAFGKSSLDVAQQFQASMKRVEGVTRATSVEMGLLTDKAMEMGATTAFTASQAADAMEVLAKNGLSVSQILGGALDATLAMASALGSELGPSADLATDLMLQFQLQAADLPAIADAVTGAALTSKFGFDDLRLAIGQAGGVAGKFGMDVNELLTSLSATASAFASGSDAGTSFKNFLQRLVPQSKQAQEAMAALGLEFFDSTGTMKSMAEISEELKTGIAGLSDEARNQALQQIFGTDAIRTALMLADQGAAGFSKLAVSLAEVSAQDQAQIRLEGLDGALKELAASWEALQLESAQNGGLDVAEATVDRLTDALRYLSENFQEVEKVATRMAQALIVYLAGRGVKLIISQATAMAASYIAMAGSVSGVGTAASRAIGPMTRLSLAGRVLMGTLGGPLSLAITALSLLSLGVDLDTVSDALGEADTASGDAAEAMSAYAEASRKAAEEQENLGGKVTDATARILSQSRAVTQTEIDKLQAVREKLLKTANGEGLFNSDHVADTMGLMHKFATRKWDRLGRVSLRPEFDLDALDAENLGPVFTGVFDALKALTEENPDFSKISAALNVVAGVGGEVQDVLQDVKDAMLDGDEVALTDARDHMVSLAEEAGAFAKELEAIKDADSTEELVGAYHRLRDAMDNAVAAGEFLRHNGEESILAMVTKLGSVDEFLDTLRGSLDRTWNAATEKPEKTFIEVIGDDAEEAKRKIEALDAAHSKYNQRSEFDRASTDRGAYPRSEIAAAEKGILHLIALVEGTDKGRGYNETLDYGRYTDGPVNLISMTLKEVLELQKKMLSHPDNDHNSSAAGRYQIVGTTLKGLMKTLGLSGDELFDSKLQDRMGMELVRGRLGQGRDGFSNEWEGFRTAGTPWSTIQTGLGAQSIPRKDAGRVRADTATEENRLRILKAQEEALRRLIETGDEQVAQLELEALLFGKTASEQARLIYMHNALAEAKKAGIDVETQLTESGEKLIDVIRGQADAIAERTEQQEKANGESGSDADNIEESSDAVRAALDNFKNGGEGWKGFWDDLIGHVADKMWDLAFDPVWKFLGGILEDALSGFGGGIGLPAAASGGSLQKLAGGGGVHGGYGMGALRGSGHSRQDNMLLWGSPGEFMQPASAVDFYGLDFMESIRNRRFPRLANGGLVDRLPVGAVPSAAAMQNPYTAAGGSPNYNITVEGANGDDHVIALVEAGVRMGNEIQTRELPSEIKSYQRDPRKRS